MSGRQYIMILDADLKQFCRTGSLGSITIGMSKAEIEQLLGIPHEFGGSWPEWSPAKQQQAASFKLSYLKYPIWKYDAIEFHFGDRSGQLYLIWCDRLKQLICDGQSFQLCLWIFGATPLYKDRCLEALQDAGIAFEERVFDYGGYIHLPSGVVLSYERDEKQEIVAIELYAERYAT